MDEGFLLTKKICYALNMEKLKIPKKVTYEIILKIKLLQNIA